MKHIIFVFIFMLASVANGQAYFKGGKLIVSPTGKAGIGTTSPQVILDIQGTTTLTSVILLPRGTTAIRHAGVNGMIRYNTNTSSFEGFANGAWGSIGGAAAASANQALSNLNAVAINTALTFGSAVAGSLKTIAVASGTSPNMVVSTGAGTAANAASGDLDVYSGLPDGSGASGYVALSSASTTPNSGNSGAAYLFTGNTDSGTAGDVNIYGGDSGASGTPGDVFIKGGAKSGGGFGGIYFTNSDEGTSGHVWTQTGTVGKGHWAAAAAGGITSLVGGTGIVPTTITSVGTLNVDVGTAANKIAQLDANINLSANSFIDGYTTTATAAATTTMTIADKYLNYWTGTTTQTVKLPTTSVALGQSYRIVNKSTGSVTVQSSGANTIFVLRAGMDALFTALAATPTTAANWDVSLKSQISSIGAIVVPSQTALLSSGWTQITFASTTQDDASFVSGNTFVAPGTGWYVICAYGATITSVNTAWLEIAYSINSSSAQIVMAKDDYGSAGTNIYAQGCILVPLAVSDIIRFFGLVDTNINFANNGKFSMVKL